MKGRYKEDAVMSDRTYYSREAEEQARREQMSNAALFIMLGLVIGAVLALLFAPESGEKIRGSIEDAINERFRDSHDATHPAIRRLERELADLRKKVEDRLAEMR
jgi:gas vesicle protein